MVKIDNAGGVIECLHQVGIGRARVIDDQRKRGKKISEQKRIEAACPAPEPAVKNEDQRQIAQGKNSLSQGVIPLTDPEIYPGLGKRIQIGVEAGEFRGLLIDDLALNVNYPGNTPLPPEVVEIDDGLDQGVKEDKDDGQDDQ